MTPTEGRATHKNGERVRGRAGKFAEAAARAFFGDSLTKLSKSVGISPKTVVLWYVFLVLVVGVPAMALFAKRGLAASLHDGEAFLFSVALTLGVLYDYAKASFEKNDTTGEALAEIFQKETLGFVVLNFGALGVSFYYIFTSSESGAVGGIVGGRLGWFCGIVFVAAGLPLLAPLGPFIRSRLAAGAAPEPADDLAPGPGAAAPVPEAGRRAGPRGG